MLGAECGVRVRSPECGVRSASAESAAAREPNLSRPDRFGALDSFRSRPASILGPGRRFVRSSLCTCGREMAVCRACEDGINPAVATHDGRRIHRRESIVRKSIEGGFIMKKQSRTSMRRKTGKGERMNDLAPRGKKASGVKAGAVDMFRPGGLQPVGTDAKWIDIQSFHWGVK